MAITAEEEKRYRDEITGLIDGAYSDPSLPPAQRKFSGSLGQHFLAKESALITELTTIGRLDKDKDRPAIEESIRQMQAAERSRLIESYVNGTKQATAQTSPETAGAVSQAAGFLGFGGDGITGFIVNMISKLGAVGEFVLTGMRVGTSMFGALLGKMGFGDPGAKMIGFSEARQQVRDEQARVNGINALTTTGFANGAALSAELQNSTAAPSEIKRIDDNPNNPNAEVKNIGMDREQSAKFLRTLTAKNKAGATIPYDPGIEMAALLESASSPPLPDGKKFIAVTMPDGSLALAAGDLSTDTTTLTPTSIIKVENGALVITAATADMKPIATGATPPVQVTINQAKVVEQTLSDNPTDLRTRIAAIRTQTGARPDALVKLNTALGTLPADDKRFEGLQSVVVVLPDKTPAILSGKLDPETSQMTPTMVTVIGENNLPLSRPVPDLKPVLIQPTQDGSNLVAGTSASKISKLLTAMQGKPGMDKFAAALDTALKDPFMAIVNEEKANVKIHSMVVTLPGGKPIIITGTLSDDSKQLTPLYVTQLQGDQLRLMDPLTGSEPVDVTTGKTIIASQDTDLDGILTPDAAKNGVVKALKIFPSSDLSMGGFPPSKAADPASKDSAPARP